MKFYSHKSIRRLVAALLDEFNDLYVEKTTSTGVKEVKRIKEIQFGTGEASYFFRQEELDDINRGNFNALPKASLSLIALLKQEGRNTNRLENVF